MTERGIQILYLRLECISRDLDSLKSVFNIIRRGTRRRLALTNDQQIAAHLFLFFSDGTKIRP